MRGRGVARPRSRWPAGRLVKILWDEIGRRGETPFLHVFSYNTAAISLYQHLGFVLRCSFVLTQVSRIAGTAADG
ncbi:GNAT family N-acetyltransferase [Paraburkholderia lacunae]|uniref:GNAT family N-acetyltransferase n=1 Tax=Paraburkholderia lacunae TaxID=2211104 RepID=UPI003CC66842